MAAKKSKRRRHSRTVERKRQIEQEKLTDEKNQTKKRLDPTARLLLYGDLVFLAVISVLDANELISDVAGGIGTIIGVILLILALWFQFRPRGDGPGKGPRL